MTTFANILSRADLHQFATEKKKTKNLRKPKILAFGYTLLLNV